MKVGPAGQHVGEELLQRCDRLLVVGPKLAKEAQPLDWLRCSRVVGERHRNSVVEQRSQLQQLPGADMKQAIAAGDDLRSAIVALEVRPTADRREPRRGVDPLR